jgi:hypothetical protein
MTDAPTLTIRLQIISPSGGRLPPREFVLDPEGTLRDLLQRLIRESALPPSADWTFRTRDGTVLDPGDTIREVAARIGPVGGALELILVQSAAPGVAGAAPALPPRSGGPSDVRARPRRAEETDAEEELAADQPRTPEAPAPRAAPGPLAQRKRKASGGAGGYAGPAKPQTERQATVRYYTRMNPDRMFPLLVILSAKQIDEVVKKAVKQAVSESFRVEEGSHVEIEPVLPGCDCYPPKHTLGVEAKDTVTETFWVVPRVLGRIHGARVLVRQGERVLAEVPLDMRVAKQTLAVVCGLASLAAPYLTMGLKSLKLDYESQKADGFPLYQRVGNWIAENLRPEWLGLGFLGLALLLYLWMRPRRRDVFWDVSLAQSRPLES